MSQTSEKYIVINSCNNKSSGIFCHVCDFLLKTADDAQTFEEWQTCHDCYLRFIESRKKEWKDGWRPKQDDVDKLYSEKSRIFIK